MAEAKLNRETRTYDEGHDAIVITRMLADIPGGVTLDTEGYSEPFIRKGQVVIQEDASGVYKPLGLTGNAYTEIPVGHSFRGVVISTTPTHDPRCGVMTQGQVNEKASPYAITDKIKKGLPLIEFI